MKTTLILLAAAVGANGVTYTCTPGVGAKTPNDVKMTMVFFGDEITTCKAACTSVPFVGAEKKGACGTKDSTEVIAGAKKDWEYTCTCASDASVSGASTVAAALLPTTAAALLLSAAVAV